MTPEETFAQFFNVVKVRMKERGLSISALSRKAGISRETLHHYFSGRHKSPELKRLIYLASALGLRLRLVLELQESSEEPHGDDS